MFRSMMLAAALLAAGACGARGQEADEVRRLRERVDLLEVNLRAGEVTTHPWDETRLDEIRARLRLSIRGMKAWLRDADANLAVLDDFERTEDLRLCRWCNFKGVCRPELLSPAP